MSRRTKGFFLAVLLVLVFSSRGLAQTRATSTTTASMPSMQMTNIPYFSLRDGMDSTLTLNNLASQPTVVNVTIFNTHGQAHALAPMTLPPRAITELDLSQSVDGRAFDSGNVEISYNGQMMQVTAQVSIFSIDKRVDIESREADMMDFASSTLAGILSLPQPDAEGFVAITNVAPTTLPVTLVVGAHKRELRLSPRETQLVRLNDEFSNQPPSASLIRLQDQGLPGDIVATGYVLNRKTGYSSAFWMVDPASAGSSTLAGVHFWAGAPPKAAGFPEGTFFHSPLLLANVSDVPVNAQIFINFTQTSAKQTTATGSSSTSSQSTVPQHVNVGDLTIPPGGVQTLDLADAATKLGSADSVDVNGFEVTYSGAPGGLIGHLTSADASGDYSFEVPVRDPAGKDIASGGAYPWTLQNGTDTTLHLMNTSDKATWAIVEFRFPDGTTYDPGRIMLQPYQTFAIDIQTLRGSKQADIRDNLFAATEDHGQLIWLQGTMHALIGRAEQVNVGDGFARSFSCAYCTCPPNAEDGYLSYPTDTFDVGYDNTGSNDDYYTLVQYEDCQGNGYGPYYVASGWTLGDTSIANVVNTNAYGSFIAAYKAGSTSIVSSWEDELYYDDEMGDCTDEGPVPDSTNWTVNVNGGPTIKLGGCASGTNVANQTTSVVIGQQIVLCTDGTYPSGVSASSYSWSIPGTIVGGYSYTGGTLTTSVTTNTQTITFYWPYAATSQVATLTINLSNGIQTSITATFNITAPSPDTPTVTLPYSGAFSVFNLTGCTGLPSVPALVFGHFTAGDVIGCPGYAQSYVGTAGIQFAPPTTSSPSGQFFFIQLIDSDVSMRGTCTTGLDTESPYENAMGSTVPDAPFVQIQSGTSASRTFYATMYLMWKSSTASAIAVPIGSVAWNFSGSATESGGTWTPSGSGSASSFVAASTTSDFPTWSGTSSCP